MVGHVCGQAFVRGHGGHGVGLGQGAHGCGGGQVGLHLFSVGGGGLATFGGHLLSGGGGGLGGHFCTSLGGHFMFEEDGCAAGVPPLGNGYGDGDSL